MHHLLAIAHPQCTRSDGHPPHTPYRQNEARRILLFGFCTRCRRSGTPGGASDVVRVRPLSVVALAFIEIGRVRKSGAPSSFKFVYTSSNPIVLGSLWSFQGEIDNPSKLIRSLTSMRNGPRPLSFNFVYVGPEFYSLHHHPASIGQSSA